MSTSVRIAVSLRGNTARRAGLAFMLAFASAIVAGTALGNTAKPPVARFVAFEIRNPQTAVDDNAVGYNVFLKGVSSEQIDQAKTGGKKFSVIRSARNEFQGIGKNQSLLGVTLFLETPEGTVLGPKQTDKITITFKVGNAPKEIKFGEISNLRSGRGITGNVLREMDKPAGAKLEGDPVFTFLAADSQPSHFVNHLQFWLNPASIPLPEELLDFDLGFGFDTARDGVFVNSIGSDPFDVPGSIDLEHYFLARDQPLMAGESVIGVVYGFQTEPELVPLPSTLLLLVIGIAVLGVRGNAARRARFLNPKPFPPHARSTPARSRCQRAPLRAPPPRTNAALPAGARALRDVRRRSRVCNQHRLVG